MKTIVSFTGRLGSGKDYQTMKLVSTLKEVGNTIYMISFADPFKQVLASSFGFDKNGKIKANFPEFTKTYVKCQIIDSLYSLIKPLKYEKFNVSETDLKAYIARNYEKHEDEFYNYIWGAVTGHDPLKHEPIEYSLAYRKLLQLFGTELGRHLVDSIWVDIAFDKITKVFKSNLANYAFINDLRFVNEYERLVQFREETAYDAIVYGVVASDETRSTRRGLSMEELKIQDNHASEVSIGNIIDLLPEEFIIQND